MSHFKVGDVVEGLTLEARHWVNRYGNVVVSISVDGHYLRFPGCPKNGYKADKFKLVENLNLENE